MRVAYSGRLIRGKGLVELCEAIWGLEAVELNVFGEGPLSNHLRWRFRGGNISFAGFIDSVDQRYADVDLFILPSRSEGCPHSALEAMAYGLPCLLTDIPAHREISQDGTGAILFSLEDADSIKQRLIALRDSPEQRLEFARRGQEIALSRYNEDTVRSRYLQVIESAAR